MPDARRFPLSSLEDASTKVFGTSPPGPRSKTPFPPVLVGVLLWCTRLASNVAVAKSAASLLATFRFRLVVVSAVGHAPDGVVHLTAADLLQAWR